MNKEIKDIIWSWSKPAEEYPKDWYVIPAIEVIEILEGLRKKNMNVEESEPQ